MAKCIMVQGTMSGAGKSLLTAALCRIFSQDGYRVAPFKSQNMALNSCITHDGFEMGRAQAVQARAAGKAPDVRMNPILLKPSSDTGSQLIVNGRVRGNYSAKDYFAMKHSLIPEIMDAYRSLASENDIIVIEGAGSPAEINLKKDDIVNMGLARMVNAPVLLVGDIDRGGVFAQLYGTVSLLEAEERRRVIGMIINKFRGDPEILRPGLSMLEEKAKLPVLGIIPYSHAVIDDEDSLAPELEQKQIRKPVDIAIIRLPHISNFTDFLPLEQHPLLGIRYVSFASELKNPDLVILPGTKNTMGDLEWLRQSGLESLIIKRASSGTQVLGICGGYQMLGRSISDPLNTEHGGQMAGMGLLPADTVFADNKKQTLVNGKASGLGNVPVHGYEIHMGRTVVSGECKPFCLLENGAEDGAVFHNVMGTYLHGLFDSGEGTKFLANDLLKRKGLEPGDWEPETHDTFLNCQFDLLADEVRSNLDIHTIYREMECFAAGRG